MRAKACTTCRQWKARCDATPGVPEPCSRCRSLKLTCVFDASFKRASRAKHLQQMSSEIERLRQALSESRQTYSPSDQMPIHDDRAFPDDWQPSLSGDTTDVPCPIAMAPTPNSAVSVSHTNPIDTIIAATPYRVLGDVSLTCGQVSEHFRAYFARSHVYLPFKIKIRSPEATYAKSPLLFWVICAVTSTSRLRSRLEPLVKAMVSENLHSPSRTVETIQALLILCIWPFPFLSLSEDPSHFYSGLAIQLSLQLGLHCPTQAHSHQQMSASSPVDADGDIKMTTWLACFVVSQMQSSVLGVPPTMLVDYRLLNDFSHPAVDTSLAQMCRIYHILTQSTLALSGHSPTSAHLPAPEARLEIIKACGEQFATLQSHHLTTMNDIVKIVFLCSRTQVWSFAMFDDMPESAAQFEIIKYAEKDSTDLIELCYNRNLAISPIYIRWAMSFCAFVLVKILRNHRATERELLEDSIERTRQALVTTTSSEDITRKACYILEHLTQYEDRRLTRPIISRMGSSVMYDLLRIYTEHLHGMQLTDETRTMDLDGFDWGFLGI